ncbi:MAG: PAS domain S-box protein [Acidobacteriota bacterium]
MVTRTIDDRARNKFFDPTIADTAEQAVEFITNILESSTEYSIIGQDLDGKILLWNEGACRLYGYQPEEVAGKANSRILYTAEDVAAGKPQRMLDMALRDGHWEGTIARQRKNGSQFKAAVVITARRDALGNPVGFLLMSRDVSRGAPPSTDDSERVNLFDSAIVGSVELDRAVSQLGLQRIALDTAADGILITDPEGVILWVNPAFTITTGYRAEEAVGKTPRILKSGRQSEAFYRGFWKTILSGKMWRGEFVNKRKDGSIYYAEHTVTPVCDADQVVTHFVGIMHDITKRKQAEEQLRDAHGQMRDLLEHSPAVLYALKLEGDWYTPRLASENITRLLGYPVAEALVEDWWPSRLHPEDRAHAEASILETLSQGESRTEFRLRHKDGTYRWIDDHRRLVRDGAGTPVELVGVWTDITESRRVRDELQESERRFREMNNNLELISIMLDSEACLTYCNDYFLRLTGWRREELVGRDAFKTFVSPDDAAELREMFPSLLANSPDAWHHTNQILTRSGEKLLVQWNNSVLRSTAGEVIGVASIGEDITSRTLAESELRRSEERLRIIIDASTDAIWERDIKTGAMVWSVRVFSLLGLTRKTFQPTFEEFRALIHPDDIDVFQTQLAIHLEKGEPYRVRLRLRHANGAYIPVLARGQLQQETGQMLGSLTDLSFVERAEEQIRMQAALIDQAHDAIVVRDLDDRITFWSKGAERLYHWSSTNALGSHYGQLLHLDTEEFANAKRRVLADGVWSGEVEKTTAVGRVVLVDSSWTLLRHEQGEPKGILVLDMDLSARKNAEAQLEESEERYRLLFDRNPHPTWVYDKETLCFLAVNEAAVRHYGYSRDEFLHMTIKDIRPREEIAELLRMVQEESESPAARVYGIVKHKKKDGTLLDVEIASSEITFSGRPAGLVLANDVTERRRSEQQFLRAQRMESLGTLAGGIAHDLNNLLMPILMGVTLLKRLETDERTQKTINNIERSVKRGTDLVKRVLLFARGTEGVRAAVNLGSIVTEVEAIAESTFPKNIIFATTLPETLHPVTGDETQLTQVVLNLCVNARDAMPGGGLITISAANIEIDEHYAVTHGGISAGKYVQLEVTDNGNGIPKEVVDRIFEPFFTTKEVGKGTGLGLSTVQGVLHSHGGFIEVSSEIGKGATFRVYLPSHSFAATASEDETEVGPLPRGNGETILVVDDEASILSITKQTLEAFGYAVLTAEDGARAIGIYAHDHAKISLVITDMMMPVIDGAALITALRRINPGVLVIAVSGQAESSSIARGTNAGATTFLAKPISAEIMLRTIFHVLGGSSVPPT